MSKFIWIHLNNVIEFFTLLRKGIFEIKDYEKNSEESMYVTEFL